MHTRQCKKCNKLFLVSTNRIKDGFYEYICMECEAKEWRELNQKQREEVIYWQ